MPGQRGATGADPAGALLAAHEQQAAVADILRVISRSPKDLKAVFDVIATSARRFCSAEDAMVALVEGDRLVSKAHEGPVTWVAGNVLLDRQLPAAGCIVDGRTIHVRDIQTDPTYARRSAREIAVKHGIRTVLATPMLHDGKAIGSITLRRTEVLPFTDEQIELVRTFADQAAIAIENVRLFNETKESLERQTALAEILRVIADSPADQQPVVEAIARNTTRYCGADDVAVFLLEGEVLRRVAHHGPLPFISDPILPVQREAVAGRAVLERRTIHVADAAGAEGDDFPITQARAALTGQHGTLATPMLREGKAVGVILLRKADAQGFAPSQIQLVEAFADQAVIAIENVRLFNETKEALERQTATSSILNVISRSPADQQPTLDAIVESGARLCEADMAFIYVVEEGFFKLRAGYKVPPAFVEYTNAAPIPVAPHRGSLSGRVVAERRAVQVPDVLVDTEYAYLEGQRLVGYRAMLNVPMFSKGELIGLIGLWRTAPVAFTAKQIDLMSTFADQAVIAIENTRLFNETREALERQSAISDVLKTISGTVFDLEPTLQTVVENAAKLADADVAWMMHSIDNSSYTFGPRYGRTPHHEALFGERRALFSRSVDLDRARGSIVGRVYAAARTIEVPDIQGDAELLRASPTARATRSRSVLGVPVLSEGVVTGAIILARVAVRPFSEREVQLVETFADQAAIAIRNVRLFNEIQDKSRQLEVASRHKSEFLANMSHELRTPLNAIIGFSEVLVQGLFGDVNDKQREYLHDVIGSGQHLLSLINDILDLSKIEAGRMELEVSTFPFRSALQSGVTIVRERAARNGIALEVDVSDEVAQVEADERKVKQILYNLLSNAVKFTPDGGRVDVTVRRDNDDVRVEVRDNGIGIAQDDQARIFEEFQQVGRERSREGTGLGLTLTKRFVELHGGRIWVESAPGQGSTFAFTLPLRRAAAVRA